MLQLKPRKFIYYEKYYENSILKEPTLHKVVEQLPAKEEFKFLGYLPAVYNAHAKKLHEHTKYVPYAFS